MPLESPDAVLGFLFAGHKKYPHVALIQKARPDWQKGKFNGLGGKVRPGESPAAAMTREFYEESGLWLLPHQWRLVVKLRSLDTGYVMWVYTTYVDEMAALKFEGDEPCYWCGELPDAVVPNLRWLVPLCRDERLVEPVELVYRRPAEDKPCTPSTST